jgi:broad specificity phosphatase PhoE
MNTLTLVRHAQACLFAEDYDRLSPLGERQALALGEYWARSRTAFDRVFSGPARRHLRTAELAGEACRKAGLEWPEPVVLPDLDEFPAQALVERYLPRLAPQHPRLAALHREMERAEGTPERTRAFERLFTVFTGMWARQEFDASEVETWERFAARVSRGLSEVRNHGASAASVAVFSSAGPVGIGVQAALGLDPAKTMELILLVRNTACSEFLFSDDRFWLRSFNAVSHLDDPALITDR